MGITYEFVNHDRRQRFSVGLGRWDDKWRGVGLGQPANRGLGLLLSGLGKLDDGSDWRGNRIEVIGDEGETYETIRLYTDIELDVIFMVLRVDGVVRFREMFDELDSGTAAILCHYFRRTRDAIVKEILESYYGDAQKACNRMEREQKGLGGWFTCEERVIEYLSRIGK